MNTNRNSESDLRSGAFTLVELLVVIGMVGLWALMLAPALARTSPSVKAWQCINNLQHWSQAEMMYASDNSDGIPRDGLDASGVYPGANGASKDPHAWFNLLTQYMAQAPLSNYTATATGNPKINSTRLPFPGGVGKIWECPAAHMSDSDLMQVSGGGADGFFSYTFNMDLKWQTITDKMPYPRMPKLAALQKPVATVLMTDSVFSSDEGFAAGNFFYSVNPAARWRSFPNRHNKEGGILAFCDGHAAYFKRAKITAEQNFSEPLLSDVIWNPPYRIANP